MKSRTIEKKVNEKAIQWWKNFNFKNEIRTSFLSKRIAFAFAVFSATSLAASMSTAKVECIPLVNAISDLELVKSQLASSEYEVFVDFVSRSTSTSLDAAEFSKNLKGWFPQGFESCETLIAENKSPKFFQELVLLHYDGSKTFFMYWASAKIAGQWTILEFNMSGNYQEVIEEWK